MNGRRWFLKGLIALPLVPLATKLAAAVELAPLESAAGQAALAARFPTVADIIAATIESRSARIADMVSENNALLMMLKRSALSPGERLVWDQKQKARREREFKEQLRTRGSRQVWDWPCLRPAAVCTSGYAAWRDSLGVVRPGAVISLSEV